MMKQSKQVTNNSKKLNAESKSNDLIERSPFSNNSLSFLEKILREPDFQCSFPSAPKELAETTAEITEKNPAPLEDDEYESLESILEDLNNELDATLKNSQKKSVSRELLPKNYLKEILLTVTTFLHFCACVVPMKNEELPNDSRLKAFSIGSKLLLGGISGLMLIDRVKHYFKMNYQIKPIAEEIEKTDHITALKVYDRFPFFVPKVKIESKDTITLEESAYYKPLKITFKPGNGSILKRVIELNAILTEIRAVIGKDKLTNYVFPLPPKFLQSAHKLFPYGTPICDMPSKMRYIGFVHIPLTLVPYLANTPPSFFLYSLIIQGLLLAENYILNDNKVQYDLEGFKELYKDYVTWPPTCIGQQLTSKFAFFPKNKNLKIAMNFMKDGFQLLQLLSHDGLLNGVPTSLKMKIDALLATCSYEPKLINSPIEMKL